MIRETRREGDKVIVTESKEFDAEIDWQDLYDAVEFEGDDSGMGPPWIEWDGYEHLLVDCHEDQDDAVGYLPPGNYWQCGDKRGRYWGKPQMVVLTEKLVEGLGVFKDMHKRGASRQVAREGEAHVVRQLIESVAKMHRNGWEYHQAVLKWNGEYYASLGGIDGVFENGYDKHLRRELADEAAAQLEKEGFTIVNRPKEEKKLKVMAYFEVWPELRHGGDCGDEDPCAAAMTKYVSKDGMGEMLMSKSLTAEEWKQAYRVNIHADDNKSERHWTQSKAFRKAKRMLGRNPVRNTQELIDHWPLYVGR